MQLNQVQRFPNSMNYPSKYRNRVAADGTPRSMNYNYCPCAGLENNRQSGNTLDDNKQSDNVLAEPPTEEDNQNTVSGHSKATCPCRNGQVFAPESEYLSLATSRDDERLQRLSRQQSSNSNRNNKCDETECNLQLQESGRRGDKLATDDTRNFVVRHLLVQAITLMDGCECASSHGPSQRGDESEEAKCALQITNASRLEVVEGKLSTTCPQATITIPVSSFPCAILFKPNADNTDFNVTHVPLSSAPGAKVFGAPYGATTIYGDLDGPCPATCQSETKSGGVTSLKEITDVDGAETSYGRTCVDKCQNTESLRGLDASGYQCICVEKPSVSSAKRSDDLAKTLEKDPSQSSAKGVPGTSEIEYPISTISECDCPSLSSTKDPSVLAQQQSGVGEHIQGSEHSVPRSKALDDGPEGACSMASKGVCEEPECNETQCDCSDIGSVSLSAKDGTKTLRSEPSALSKKESGEVDKRGSSADNEAKSQEGKDDTQTSEHSLASKKDPSVASEKITASDGESGIKDKVTSDLSLSSKKDPSGKEGTTQEQEGKDDTQTSEHSLGSKKDPSVASEKITTSDGADIVESVIKDTVTSDLLLSSKKDPSGTEVIKGAASSVSSKKEPSLGMSAAECDDAECECMDKPSESRTGDKQPSEMAKSLASAVSEAPTQMDDMICSNADCDCVNKPSDFSHKQLQSDGKSVDVSNKPSEVSYKPSEVSNKPSEASALHTKDSTALDDILCSNTACECINRPSAFSRSVASAALKKSLDDVSATSTKGPNSVLECKCDFEKFKGDSRAILAQYECELDDTECEAAREELYKKLNATKPSSSLTEGRPKSPSTCNCCYCQTRRRDREQNANAEINEISMPRRPYRDQNANAEMNEMSMPRRPDEDVYDDGASAATGLQADYKEMKFFIDSLVFDYEVMQSVRQKSRDHSCGCSSKSLARDSDIPEGDGFPATITNVRRVGCKALFVNWAVRNGVEIGGFELYLDEVLYNRYRSNDHRAGLIYNVDIKTKHIVMLKTLPVGFDDCGCGYKGGNADSNKNWSPSVFVYEPISRKSNNKQLEPLAAEVEVEETNNN